MRNGNEPLENLMIGLTEVLILPMRNGNPVSFSIKG